MKTLKVSLASFLVALTAFVFIACQKDAKDPSVTSGATTLGPAANFTVSILSTPGTGGCYAAGGDFTITAKAFTPGGSNPPGNGGDITITEYLTTTVDGVTTTSETNHWTTSGFNETITPAPTVAGSYSYKASFALGNANILTSSMSLPVVVTETCEAGLCNVNSTLIAKELDEYFYQDPYSQSLSFLYYGAVFSVNICAETTFSNPLKLQGGLTAGCTLYNKYGGNNTYGSPVSGVDNGVNYTLSNSLTNKNVIVNWKIDNVTAPYSKDFTVYFTKNRAKYPDDNMTGAWSLKDKQGALLGQYTDRLLYSNVFTH